MMDSGNTKIPVSGISPKVDIVDRGSKKKLTTNPAIVHGKIVKSRNHAYSHSKKTIEKPVVIQGNKPSALGARVVARVEARVEARAEARTVKDCICEKQVEMMFQRIFSDGEKCSLSRADISTDRQPEWFQSRWVWKVICLFDNAIRDHGKGLNLDQLINQIEKRDPFFRFILSSTFCLDSGSLANQLALDEKSKHIIPLWLRYSLAGEGFDVSEQWLHRFLRTPSENQWMSTFAEETLQFKFPEGYPGYPKVCDSSSIFTKPCLKAIGMKPEHVCIDRQPDLMPYSLWLVVRECSHWLKYCQKHHNKLMSTVSTESSHQLADLVFLKGLLHCFFSAQAGLAVKSDLLDTGAKRISYHPLAWGRLQMELILDRMSIQYYPEFAGWRSWLESGKSA